MKQRVRPFWGSGIGCGGMIVIAVLFFGLLFGGCYGLTHATQKTRTLTVTRLDDQATRKGHKYLVFTRQGVFEDTDSIFYLKFNSSDLWAKLQVGKTYRCTTIGLRIPFFSAYPDLVNCGER